MERIQKERSAQRKSDDVQPLESDSKEALKADLDDVLDEIDGVLEENAEQFVKSYVQKGGE